MKQCVLIQTAGSSICYRSAGCRGRGRSLSSEAFNDNAARATCRSSNERESWVILVMHINTCVCVCVCVLTAGLGFLVRTDTWLQLCVHLHQCVCVCFWIRSTNDVRRVVLTDWLRERLCNAVVQIPVAHIFTHSWEKSSYKKFG